MGGRDIRNSFAAFTAYTLLTIGATWPLTRDLTSKLAGDALDPIQSLWNLWWWRHAVADGTSPFATYLLWWPDGVSLWFQTWDLPSIWWTWPFWRLLPEVALYNLALLLSFPLAGLTFYLLCLELWPKSRLAAFLAGCLYTFSTFHFAHARMQLHIASMQWTPLFALGLTRMAAPEGARLRGAVLTGVGLSMALLASVYHALFCAIVVLVLVATRGLGAPQALWSRVVIARTALATAIFVALTGWLLAGLLLDFTRESFVGGHDPILFSADVMSFVVPNQVSVWSPWFPSSLRWIGKAFESASYAGLVTLALAAAAWPLGKARPYLWLAAVGAVLALGPFLHVNGIVSRGLTLPEAWLEQLVPPLRFSGMPVRFSWLTTFGLAAAAGATLSRLCCANRSGRALAIVLVALSLAETWPKPFPMTTLARPAVFEDWARDSGEWAVLDATDGSRPLWHQMLHHHPIIAGYVSRTPERLWNVAQNDPVLRVLLPPPIGRGAGTLDPQPTLAALRAKHIRYVVIEQERAGLLQSVPLRARRPEAGLAICEVD